VTNNYTVLDLIGIGETIATFSLFFIAPGYLFGLLIPSLRLREKSPLEKTLWAVLLSVSLTPLIASLLGRISLWVAIGTMLAMDAVFLVILFRGLLRQGFPKLSRVRRSTWAAWIIVIAWTLATVGTQVDWQIGHKLYWSSTTFDHSVRTAFVGSAARTGVPPQNPFYYPGHPVGLRYYYFWIVACALPVKLAGADPRLAMLASTAWCGYALLALIPLMLKLFCEEKYRLRRRSILGMGLLLVTGLDLIPTLVFRLSAMHNVFADMEWWDGNQITSWLDSLMFVPHHVAGLIACMAGLLVLWSAREGYSTRDKMIAASAAGALFASTAGSSVYVALAFGVAMVMWYLLALLGRWHTDRLLIIVSGTVAVILSIPYLHELLAAGAGGGFAVIAIREFRGLHEMMWHYGLGQEWVNTIASILFLPMLYLLELGFFMIVMLMRAKQDWRSRLPLPRREIVAWTMIASSFLLGSFLKSDTISVNDLGFRCFLPAQLILLLWAAPLVDTWWFGSKKEQKELRFDVVRPRVLTLMLVLGVYATIYQAVNNRVFMYFGDHGAYTMPSFIPPPGQIGEKAYEIRSLYQKLDAQIPTNAIVQHNPVTKNYIGNLLYADRQAMAAIVVCGSQFGGDPIPCYNRELELNQIFSHPKPSDTETLDATCRELHINVLVVKSGDEVWWHKHSWVWTRKPLVANRDARAIACGDGVPSPNESARLNTTSH